MILVNNDNTIHVFMRSGSPNQNLELKQSSTNSAVDENQSKQQQIKQEIKLDHVALNQFGHFKIIDIWQVPKDKCVYYIKQSN